MPHHEARWEAIAEAPRRDGQTILAIDTAGVKKKKAIADSIDAICPICVRIPVSVTTIVAVPRVTEVFWKSMLLRSPRASSTSVSAAGSFGIGALSPVSAAGLAMAPATVVR